MISTAWGGPGSWGLPRALRQEDLAELAGVGKNTVNRIKKNRTEPHMTTVRKLADGLGVEPQELVEG